MSAGGWIVGVAYALGLGDDAVFSPLVVAYGASFSPLAGEQRTFQGGV